LGSTQRRRATYASPVRTLILLLICSMFVGVAVLDARSHRKDRTKTIKEAVVAFALGVAFCWFLVYVIGIFDNWKSPWR
jgi:heme/copper-type cytochrome/quinol oxidase subunit 3